jgi:site-specific DNA recombinase
MSPEHKRTARCAIYTRKSSEEGLEQSFNSLEAQREACQAFIASQREEGWRLLPAHYDDGGYSGGNMDRPALQQLLADVGGGKVEIIVVYKVDRLTRSLSDFSKIVEALDARGISFVSVTQQFNTTTSMGRLTLNVLLSFAQFEREVTGERIRDKIAASKRKGMWMGGTLPLGYDLKDRKLVVNLQEAGLVRKIFDLYLKLGYVSRLKEQLDQDGVKSKLRVSISGKRSGGVSYSRGALYQILKNRIYLGEIAHRNESYAGQHEAIIDREVWDQVQAQLESDNQGRKNGMKMNSVSLLAGLLRDSMGNRFTPSHTVKNGKRYRYYVSQSVVRHPQGRGHSAPTRLPAHDIEKLVNERIRSFLQSDTELLHHLLSSSENPAVIRQILASAKHIVQRWDIRTTAEKRHFLRQILRFARIYPDRLELQVGRKALFNLLMGRASLDLPVAESECGSDKECICLETRAALQRCGLEMRIVIPPSRESTVSRPNAVLLKAIARAYEWKNQLMVGKVRDQRSIARQTGLDEAYVGKILRCAYFAPDIVEAVLEGRQPASLTLKQLQKPFPMNWSQQRRQLESLP